MNMNKCILLGRLTKDPDGRRSNSGVSITSFSIAVDSGYGDSKKTSFFDCKCFKQSADFVRDRVRKGDPVLLECRAEQERWTDRDSGANRSKVVFIADRVQSLAQRGGTQQSDLQPAQQPQGQQGYGPGDDLQY